MATSVRLSQPEEMIPAVERVLNMDARLDENPDADPIAEMASILESIGLPAEYINAVCTASDEEAGALYRKELERVIERLNSACQGKLRVVPDPAVGTGAHIIEGTPNYTRFESLRSSTNTISTAEKIAHEQASHHPVFSTPPEFPKMSDGSSSASITF